MKSNLIVTVVCFFVACFLIAGIVLTVSAGRHILGPRNNPNFEKLAWTSARFQYFVIEDLGGRRISRTLVVKSESELSAVRKSMRVKSIASNSLGVADDSHILMSDGEEWNVQFVFEDRVHVCKREEKYYSYVYELDNNKMYDAVRQLCLEDERKKYPNAVLTNIILRTNLTDAAYEILK